MYLVLASSVKNYADTIGKPKRAAPFYLLGAFPKNDLIRGNVKLATQPQEALVKQRIGCHGGVPFSPARNKGILPDDARPNYPLVPGTLPAA
jgi:hypothetical protein